MSGSQFKAGKFLFFSSNLKTNCFESKRRKKRGVIEEVCARKGSKRFQSLAKNNLFNDKKS